MKRNVKRKRSLHCVLHATQTQKKVLALFPWIQRFKLRFTFCVTNAKEYCQHCSTRPLCCPWREGQDTCALGSREHTHLQDKLLLAESNLLLLQEFVLHCSFLHLGLQERPVPFHLLPLLFHRVYLSPHRSQVVMDNSQLG